MNTLCKYCSFWLLSAALLLSAGGNDVPRAQSSPESPERLYPVKEMTPGYTGKFTWGLFGSSRPLKEFPHLQALLPGMDAEHKVTLIRHITPGGIGEKEGLVPGDIVIETSAYSSVTSRPGDPVKLKVWRQQDNKVSDLETQLPQYHQIQFQPYVKPSGAAEFEKELPPDWEIYAPFLQKEPLKSNFDDLRRRLTDIDSLTDAYRLPAFRYLIRNPFRLEQVSRRWADRMSAAGDWPELLPLGRYMLEFSDSAAPSSAAAWQQSHPRPGADASVEEITAYYLEVLRRCRELHQRAWAKISDEEVAFVRSHRHQAFESICRYHMLSYEPDAASAARTLKIFEILNRIDQRALFEQAETAALLRDESLLARLKSLLANRTGRLHQAQSDCGPV
ncbi:MAG: hypothetical protein J6S21_03400, partial [Victivallales bacterium]|nr:hypothetical protein [Victivallales bacterium]